MDCDAKYFMQDLMLYTLVDLEKLPFNTLLKKTNIIIAKRLSCDLSKIDKIRSPSFIMAFFYCCFSSESWGVSITWKCWIFVIF